MFVVPVPKVSVKMASPELPEQKPSCAEAAGTANIEMAIYDMTIRVLISVF